MSKFMRVCYQSSGAIKSITIAPKKEWLGVLDNAYQTLLFPVLESHGVMSTEKHYVNEGQVVLKQPYQFTINKTQITAKGIDEAVITNIPTGTTVEWPDGQTDEITDGEVRFAVDLPGSYTLTFTAVPYLTEEVTIEAVSTT